MAQCHKGTSAVRLVVSLAALVLVTAGAAAWIVDAKPDWYLRTRYPLEYENTIRTYAAQRHLDPPLVAAVIYSESRFDPNVVSGAGAVGLMQVLPETGRFIARSTGGTDFVAADLRDPDLNVRYGTWLLDHLRARYDGDIETALAAYHAGPANVDEWRRTGSGIQFPDTQAYVDEVTRVRRIYAQAYGRDLGR